jgi:hypothetical protein
MADILHILNGDATLKPFSETGLDGDVMVWREVLSEGPLQGKVDADFWNMRAAFIEDAFHSTAEDYNEKIILELGKLNQPYEEINLWFEFDLHCQVNMLGVMQVLRQQIDLSAPSIYLICPESVPGVADFVGMGELNADQLEDLYDTRLHLTDYDFTLANEAWQLYVSHDAARLQKWLDKTPFWGSLHLLKPALQAHVKRLSVDEQGLSYIEQKLLFYYEQGISDRAGLYQEFWNRSKIYGMGDAELDLYLDRLVNKGLITL